MIDVREVTPTRIGHGQLRHSDRLWVRAAARLPDDPLAHACALAYVSDLGSGFGQVEVEGLAAGGPSIDHSVWFHEPVRADEWMLLELWPLKASGSRGVYSGSLRSEDGRLGVLLTGCCRPRCWSGWPNTWGWRRPSDPMGARTMACRAAEAPVAGVG